MGEMPEVGDIVTEILPWTDREKKRGIVVEVSPKGWYAVEFAGAIDTYRVCYKAGGTQMSSFRREKHDTYFRSTPKKRCTMLQDVALTE